MIFFAISDREKELVHALSTRLEGEKGELELRSFPDGESYVRLLSELEGRTVIFVSTLAAPDPKFLSLYFSSRTAKDLGAERVLLLAPYLPYMRQDKAFRSGEAVSSAYFAELLSDAFDGLITVEPHLHRWHSLSELYTLPYEVVRASEAMASWIRENVEEPVLVGPDDESEQWVSEVAQRVDAPYVVWGKERSGDRDVKVKRSRTEELKGRCPVLVDDIISTAHTMIQTVRHLREAGVEDAVCMGVHPLFVGTAYEELRATGARIVTCNTIEHPSNAIDLTPYSVEGVKKWMEKV